MSVTEVIKKWREALVAAAGILVVVLQVINTLLASDIGRTVAFDHHVIETIGRTVASDHETITAARADQQALGQQLKGLLKAGPSPSPSASALNQ